MQDTTALTRQQVYDILRTLDVMARVQTQSDTYNDYNTVEILGFEEEAA